MDLFLSYLLQHEVSTLASLKYLSLPRLIQAVPVVKFSRRLKFPFDMGLLSVESCSNSGNGAISPFRCKGLGRVFFGGVEPPHTHQLFWN